MPGSGGYKSFGLVWEEAQSTRLAADLISIAVTTSPIRSKLGLRSRAPKPTGPFGESRDRYSVFDTKERGNGKEGHAYVMRLPNDEKEKLLEYLKTV